MYDMIRFLIAVIVFIITICLLRKIKWKNGRKPYIISIIITVVIGAILAGLPIENVFVTFPSVEAAYNYYLPKPEVVLVVEGSQCDFVIGSENGTNVPLIIPKNEDGWKIGIGIDTKRILFKTQDGLSIYVYQFKETQEYFIRIHDIQGRALSVKDSRNSKFYNYKRETNLIDGSYVYYCAYVSDMEEDYQIIVNGTSINVMAD